MRVGPKCMQKWQRLYKGVLEFLHLVFKFFVCSSILRCQNPVVLGQQCTFLYPVVRYVKQTILLDCSSTVLYTVLQKRDVRYCILCVGSCSLPFSFCLLQVKQYFTQPTVVLLVGSRRRSYCSCIGAYVIHFRQFFCTCGICRRTLFVDKKN